MGRPKEEAHPGHLDGLGGLDDLGGLGNLGGLSILSECRPGHRKQGDEYGDDDSRPSVAGSGASHVSGPPWLLPLVGADQWGQPGR